MTSAFKGYMPPEWARHERTYVTWPDNEIVWRQSAGPAQRAFLEVIQKISKFEPVTLILNKNQVSQLLSMLDGNENVNLLPMPVDDSWIRDTGPTFVCSGGKLCGIDWGFNGYGSNFVAHTKDEKVAEQILVDANIPVHKPGLILEGGSIHTDGEGTLLVTEECLLNPNRNPTLSKQEIENILKPILGIEKIIWLPFGVMHDDDTSGHVDNVACFSAPGKVLLSWTSTKSADEIRRCESNLKLLESEVDAKGRKIVVTKIFQPPPLTYTEEEVKRPDTVHPNQIRAVGSYMAASYVNFYLCNGALIMPQFGGSAEDADLEAYEILKNAFPDRDIVQISQAKEILLGGGNIHCITQQKPLL